MKLLLSSIFYFNFFKGFFPTGVKDRHCILKGENTSSVHLVFKGKCFFFPHCLVGSKYVLSSNFSANIQTSVFIKSH